MARILTLAALLCLVALAGCGKTIQQDVTDGLVSGKARAAQQQARLEAARRGHVIEEALPYFGRQVEVKPGSRQGKPLPRKFEGARAHRARHRGQGRHPRHCRCHHRRD